MDKIRELRIEREKAIKDFALAMKNADLGFIHSHAYERVSFTEHMYLAWNNYVAACVDLYDSTNVKI